MMGGSRSIDPVLFVIYTFYTYYCNLTSTDENTNQPNVETVRKQKIDERTGTVSEVDIKYATDPTIKSQAEVNRSGGNPTTDANINTNNNNELNANNRTIDTDNFNRNLNNDNNTQLNTNNENTNKALVDSKKSKNTGLEDIQHTEEDSRY